MRKRTRIFAIVSLLAGLLLGVGILLATLAPASAHGSSSATAIAAKKHHHTQTHTKTSTVTSTITSTLTSTTTVAPPPPPPPFCFAMPSTVTLGSGGPGSGNPSGNAQFVVDCQNLTPGTAYNVTWNFGSCSAVIGTGIVTINGIDNVTGNAGTFVPAPAPDLNGKLQVNFQFGGCTPGAGSVVVTNTATGLPIVTLVTLAPPASHK